MDRDYARWPAEKLVERISHLEQSLAELNLR